MVKKKVIEKFVRKSTVLVCAVVIGCGVTYFVTEKAYQTTIEDLQNQIDDLEKKELKARITQRVSEQMETVADQQTRISNQERDRAEKQSRIADSARRQADIEKGFAQIAQQKALAAADEANIQRKKAEAESRKAQQSQLIAEQERNHADTLLYMSLANSLAQSSLAQTDNDLAHLLAYSSWYFSERYHTSVANLGNIYYALLKASGSTKTFQSTAMGKIRRVHNIDGVVRGVTDYGDVVTLQNSTITSVHIGNYDFRDFVYYGRNQNIVLGVSGKVFDIDITKPLVLKNGATPRYIKKELTLPKDLWYRLEYMSDGKTLVAMGNRTVAWIDARTLTIKATKTFDNDLQTIGLQGDKLHIFDSEKNHFISDTPGVVAALDKTNNIGIVTSYLYDIHGHHIVGNSIGEIYIYDGNGNRLAQLVGHTAAITDLHMWGQLLCSTSNDNTLKLWNVTELTSIITPVDIAMPERPLSFDVDSSEDIYVACGNAIVKLCSNVVRNAETTHNAIRREFTDYEWNHYIGKDIPRVNFMK